jgi:hypothetical protein
MKRVKIKFKDLLEPHCGYPLHIVLEVLNWMVKTGKPYHVRSGWYAYGIDKQLFGYSGNDHDSRTDIKPPMLRVYFLNAVLCSAHPIIEKWRADFGIKLDGSFFLKYNDSKYIDDNWRFIQKLPNKPLKKAYYQPEYKDRINPYIKSLWIYTIGGGISIGYDYTFDCCHDSGWRNDDLSQGNNEGLSDFFDRAVIYFKERIYNGNKFQN